MANRIEAVKNYLGSVVKRTSGVDAYEECIGGYTDNPNLTDLANQSHRRDHKIISGAYRFIQLGAPATARAFIYYEGPTINKDIYPTFPEKNDLITPIHLLSSLMIDSTLNELIISNAIISQNPWEVVGKLIAYKLITNAATHISLDFIGAAAKRIRNLRPSNITLAE